MSVESRTEFQTSEILQDTMPSSTPLDTDGETLTHDSAPYTLAKVYRWLVGISKAVLGEATRRNSSKRVQGLEQTITGKITSSSTAVTGASTLFLSELYVGAFIAGTAGEYREVAAIASDVALTLVTAFSSDIGSGQNYTRLQMLSERIDALEQYENVVMNGGLEYWSAGTSFSTPASDSELANKFFANYDGTIGTFAVTQNPFTLGQTDVPGEPKYSLRWNQTASGSAQTIKRIRHQILGVRSFAGQTVQVTFYAKMGTGTDITVGATQYFGAGGGPSADVVVTAKTRTLLTSFSRHTVTLAIPSITGKTIGSTGDALFINFNLPLNATHDFYLANVSVYAGTAELPFKQPSVTESIVTFLKSVLPGLIIQTLYQQSGTADSTAVNIPLDNTKPQNTEGKEIFTQAITPTNASNKIRIEWGLNISDGGSAGGLAVISALFQDAGADALAAVATQNDDAGSSTWIHHGVYEVVAGSKTARTYKIRYGAQSGTTYLNSNSAGSLFNGTNLSWMRVTEVTP